MTDHDPGQVWREPGTFETPHQPEADRPPQSETEITDMYMANLRASLDEAARDPEAYESYEELGVVYNAARAILLAAKEGKPVTPPIPYLTLELTPLVSRLLSSRRSGSGYVNLPIQFDPIPGEERPKAENITLPGWLIGDFSLAALEGDDGKVQLFYSTFPWDKKR